MERIEDLIFSGVSAEYKGLYRRDIQQRGDAWLPSLPLPLYTLRARWSDAWLVWTGRATAVQWPEQRAER